MTVRPLTLTALTLALSITAQGASADIRMNYHGDPDVNWPFEDYRACLGYQAELEHYRPLLHYSGERMIAVGQTPSAIFARENRTDYIVIEQYLATREYIVAQCDLREAGEEYDTSCPINHLSMEEALERADASDDEFWAVHSSELRHRKEPLQRRWLIIHDELIRACRHD